MILRILFTLCWVGSLAAISDKEPYLFDLKGIYTHPISTKIPLAQKYFDQGMVFLYGYNYEEAFRDFQEAAKLDPDCAICYWGEALALRGNMESPQDIPQGAEKIKQALGLFSKASPQEQAYIRALLNSYLKNQSSLKNLDATLMKEMKKVSERYPEDLDAATLYAQLEMDSNGDLEDVKSTLRNVLAKDPHHPGANHFMIHAIDSSPHPEEALPNAKALENGVPFAGHLLHMSAHIYYKMGRYHDATVANEKALQADKDLFSKEGIKGKYFSGFHLHTWQFLIASLVMEGKKDQALQADQQIKDLLQKEKPKLSVFYNNALSAQRLLVLHHFQDWNQILKEPKPNTPFGDGIWHFAKSQAFLAKNDLKNAKIEAAAIDDESIPKEENDLNLLLQVYALNAQAAIAEKEGDLAHMADDYQDAIQLEDEIYDHFEPPLLFFRSKDAYAHALQRTKEFTTRVKANVG